MTRRRTIWLVVVLVVALVGATIYAIRYSRTELTYVVDSLLTQDGAYVVNDDGTRIQMFHMDKGGRILQRISLPKYRDDIMRKPGYLQVDPMDGRIYIYIKEHSVLTNGIALEAVYECDFVKGELALRWELPSRGPDYQVADHVAVRQGVLYYTSTDFVSDGAGVYTGQAQVWQMMADSAPEMIGAADYNADEYFAECYYSDNGIVVFTDPFGDLFYKDILAEDAIPASAPEAADAQRYGEDLGIVGDVPARSALHQTLKTAARTALEAAPTATSPVQSAGWGDGQDTGIRRVEGIRVVKLNGDSGHVLYIADETRRQVVSLNLATMEQGVHLNMNAWQASDYAEYMDLKNVRFVSDGSFSASLPTPDGRSILGVYYADGRSDAFDSLRLESGVTFRVWLLAFLAILGCCVLLWLLRRLFFWITNGKVPIVSKLIAAFIPVVIASMVGLGYYITDLFTNEMVDNQYKELLLVSQQQEAGLTSNLVRALAVEGDEDGPRTTSIYHYAMRDLLGATPFRSEIVGKDGNQDVYNIAYHWVYYLDGQDKLRSLLCDQNYMNIPIEYYHTPTVVELFYDAVREGKPVKGEFQDVGGDWICVLIPIQADGETIAVLETTTTRASLDYVVRTNTRKINNMNTLILVALLALLSGIIVYSLYPLNKLRKCVQEITYGKLGVQTNVRGNDEVAEIADTFNKMSTSIQYSVDELRSLNTSYHKFVPSQMFEILNKTSVIDVRLGDQTNREVTVMEIGPVNFDELVSGLEVGDMFQLLNNILSTIVPVIIREGGVIDKFTSGGCIAFFTANSEAAFRSSITALQQIDLRNQQGGFSRMVEMAAGISFGPVMIGIVGHDERLEATNISEHTNLVGYLGRIAPIFNARVLTTATTLELVREYGDKYHARNIGFLRIRSSDQMHKLYDVFDGDEEEIRFLKQQTKDLFEKGVELYCRRKFYDARLVFIEVLKKFRQDAAAKEYLYLCDQYYQMSNPEDVDICIAKY